ARGEGTGTLRGVALHPLHALAVGAHVVAVDAGALGAGDGVDLAVVAGDRFGDHVGLALERVRLVGVAVVPVQRPIERARAGGAEGQQPETTVVAHAPAQMMARAMPSRKVPTVSAASSSFQCCTGTLPMVSPVRPLTAM